MTTWGCGEPWYWRAAWFLFGFWALLVVLAVGRLLQAFGYARAAQSIERVARPAFYVELGVLLAGLAAGVALALYATSGIPRSDAYDPSAIYWIALRTMVLGGLVTSVVAALRLKRTWSALQSCDSRDGSGERGRGLQWLSTAAAILIWLFGLPGFICGFITGCETDECLLEQSLTKRSHEEGPFESRYGGADIEPLEFCAKRAIGELRHRTTDVNRAIRFARRLRTEHGSFLPDAVIIPRTITPVLGEMGHGSAAVDELSAWAGSYPDVKIRDAAHKRLLEVLGLRKKETERGRNPDAL